MDNCDSTDQKLGLRAQPVCFIAPPVGNGTESAAESMSIRANE